METKPVKTEADYQAALDEIESLFFADPGTPEGDRLEVLVALVKDYESKHFTIPDPDPIEAIKFHMGRLNLTRKDLEPYLGSRARVSEVLNRKRPLTISMIRRLQEGLGIPATILVKDYPLNVESRSAQYSP
jgi:HTH-type transcriptional regulator/antitoxin HigA